MSILFSKVLNNVVPYVGTWIEIPFSATCTDASVRRSLRGNVDRNRSVPYSVLTSRVVPYVGTWIEILTTMSCVTSVRVVPYVGTWIEIPSLWMAVVISQSFPTWERG